MRVVLRSIPRKWMQVHGCGFAVLRGRPYDWRDDPDMNPSYQHCPRSEGCRDPIHHEFPQRDPPKPALLPLRPMFPLQYDQKDLTMNYTGCINIDSMEEVLADSIPQQYIPYDVPHEFVYQSEDGDFQSMNFKTMHFRKKGRDSAWMFACLMPLLFLMNQAYYQQTWGQNNCKFQRPPPLNYPQGYNDDYLNFANDQSLEYKILNDAAFFTDPHMEIIDGKKVYNKWAGVNSPWVLIK